MPTHFVYDEMDPSALFQGDVLKRTDSLDSHLNSFHPHYGHQADYKFFMVLTQSCDLVRRSGRAPKSSYITLAAVRPIEDVLAREAAKHQDEWQRGARVISAKAKDRLVLFMQRLLDNNEDGYFYLHTDVGTGIDRNCCAFLQLAVALKIDHYDLCLNAKICQLKESFQAKLGHLIGHMYSRVGTAEWNSNYPANSVAKEAKRAIDNTFYSIDDQQIIAGLDDLRREGVLGGMSPDQIRDEIVKRKVRSRKVRFEELAVSILQSKAKPLNHIRGRIESALRADNELRTAIDLVFQAAGVNVDATPQRRDEVIDQFCRRLGEVFSDEHYPDAEKTALFKKILGPILQDAIVTKIMQ